MDTPHPQMLALGAEMRLIPSSRDSWPPHPSRLRGVPHPSGVNGRRGSAPSTEALAREPHPPIALDRTGKPRPHLCGVRQGGTSPTPIMASSARPHPHLRGANLDVPSERESV